MKPDPQPLLSSDRAGAQEALAELRDTSDQEVSAATSRAAGITEEDERGLKREHRTHEDKAWADMRVFCIKALGWMVVTMGSLVALAILAASGVWLYEQAMDPAKLDRLMEKSLFALFGAAAAFVGRRVFQSKDNQA